MSKASRQAAFDKEFRGHIEKFTKPLVSALRKITKARLPSVIKILAFEIQSDWQDFPVYVFSMDDKAPNEVYFKPPFNGELLPEVGELIPDDAIDQDSYEEAGVATFESGARILAEWFGECWHTAGGAKFPIPAYINHHDRSHYFDLRSRRWVPESEIW